MGGIHPWYTLYTKAQKEQQVARYLRERQLEVYLPLISVSAGYPKVTRETAFFPGYLFVRFDVAINLSQLQWTPGLKSLVQIGGEPALVPDQIMRELRQRINQIQVANGQVLYGVKPGDTVKIKSGLFAGYEAIFDLRRGKERVRVLLRLINHTNRGQPEQAQLIPVELNASNIESVKPK